MSGGAMTSWSFMRSWGTAAAVWERCSRSLGRHFFARSTPTSGLAGGDAEQRSADDWLRVCSWQLWAQWPMMDRLFTASWSSTTQAEIEARESQRR
jgi:hypothetical protein